MTEELGLEPAGRRRVRRLFERGDIKYVVLGLLEEQPRHGYDIIRELEDRLGGFYTPSPGSVYPTLDMLADMGWVRGTEQEGKKVFAITEEGRRFLEDRRDILEQIRARVGSWWSPGSREELRAIRRELRSLEQVVGRQRGRWDLDRLKRAREVISGARKEIEEILHG